MKEELKKIIYIANIAAIVYFGIMFIFNLTNSTNSIAYSFFLELFTIPSLLVILITLAYWIYNMIKYRNYGSMIKIGLLNLTTFLIIVLFYKFF
ncbi:hypothetical protein [Flavobacterium rakeshii]|uniref:hypothetical protein n=1 Tax=Flavobacterium rakeshii TaxID=1038845 RepID=UPI002E7B833D|nr:hypothetical protein [Flavobacterium rakeshii]